MRLKHMVLDKVHCLTMEHEVLTENGWKHFNDITNDDKLLTLDTTFGNSYYEPYIEKLHFNKTGRLMYHIKNKNIDTIVTSNHRFPYVLEDDEEIKIDYIENIINNYNKKLYFLNKECKFEIKLQDIKAIDSNEEVFCFTMSKGTFYVRRNGIEHWTGNSRSTGPRQALTRQPLEGRARAGGLRIGEMEKDSIEAHGMGQFTKERMMETSDIANFKVCDDCGLLATKVIDKDYYVCTPCNNHTRISSVNMPYATKLLFQELMSINILPKIKTENTKYD
jgi:hypothetical protein